MRKKTQPLWITWESQVRNRSMSAQLGAHLLELDVSGGPLKRYALCIARTIAWTWRWRGGIIFVQNPSIVLATLALLLRPFLRYTLIMDAHNAGIYPAEGRNSRLQRIADWLIAHVDLVLVTNEGLARRVREVGGRPFVMPDPLPALTAPAGSVGPAPTVLFVCTWASDEPYVEVFKAAELLPDVTVHVTGRSKGRESAFGRKLPPNVVLTGFVPRAEYERLLTSAHAVVDLTTREDCLVCGAYESVAAGAPFVLSNTKALREYFRVGGVHVDNEAGAIAAGIRAILNDYGTYRAAVERLRRILETEWNEKKHTLLATIEGQA
jgi:glycosyltransferase involved in cell wall biosynthesis